MGTVPGAALFVARRLQYAALQYAILPGWGRLMRADAGTSG